MTDRHLCEGCEQGLAQDELDPTITTNRYSLKYRDGTMGIAHYCADCRWTVVSGRGDFVASLSPYDMEG